MHCLFGTLEQKDRPIFSYDQREKVEEKHPPLLEGKKIPLDKVWVAYNRILWHIEPDINQEV